MTDLSTYRSQSCVPTDPGSLEQFRERREAERRMADRGQLDANSTLVTYALLTADGTLGFVTSPRSELNDIMTERDQLLVHEYGRDPMPVIAGLTLYFAVPTAASDQRPLNLVANTLAGRLDPEGGWGRYRGTVAFLDGYGLASLTPDQREQLGVRYREAHQSVRAWQRRQLNRSH
ncbi:MAG TPA: hypothetical protein VN520_20890 [Streptomyces sp.]|uniref:hypothetical protein n=1 Tax=Streptomyces sp. TaxID=1931 RepID=UPI002CD7BEFA|nr:hypothetical protein [Streptomyces sp.]HWU08804.1 hypothetical protein [Streptomyces sp.]